MGQTYCILLDSQQPFTYWNIIIYISALPSDLLKHVMFIVARKLNSKLLRVTYKDFYNKAPICLSRISYSYFLQPLTCAPETLVPVLFIITWIRHTLPCLVPLPILSSHLRMPFSLFHIKKYYFSKSNSSITSSVKPSPCQSPKHPLFSLHHDVLHFHCSTKHSPFLIDSPFHMCLPSSQIQSSFKANTVLLSLWQVLS